MVSAVFFRQSCETANYQFTFHENPEEYALELQKGLPVYRIVFCTVTDKHRYQIVAVYKKVWNKKTGDAALQNFINRFMVDKDFRKEFFLSGTEVNETNDEYASIHPECKRQIRFLNVNEGRLSFQDFAELKTYGKDAVSMQKASEIMEEYPDEVKAHLSNYLPDTEDMVKALRWIKRGLSVKNAIRKVKVDAARASRAKAM